MMGKHSQAPWALSLAGLVLIACQGRLAAAEPISARPASIVHKVVSANERQEMTVMSSRILTLDQKIPQAQVNNPEIVELTPLSPTQIQLSAKKAGVTQVNLWDENNRIFTIDVIVRGDTSELSMVLSDQFPNASLQVSAISTGVVISGFVDDPDDVPAIIQIAEQYYPKVINNMRIGGVQQVLLHIKVIEVSRTKLRELGFDWTQMSAGGGFILSGAAGLLSSVTQETGDLLPTFSPGGNVHFGLTDGGGTFFGVLEAMERNNLAKLLAEPTLVTVSGRPAQFQVGGEVPVITGGGLGVPANTVYKPYGTQVDFVPIVLGNGRIRLEVRPRVSEIDPSRSVGESPAFRVRQVDTGVEMQAGQTLAIAGLLQTRIESSRSGLPWLSDVPYLGTLFRRVNHERNEVELLVIVTPELVEAMEYDQVPPCGPGMMTGEPNDWELYLKGYVEVPNRCSSDDGAGCPEHASSGVSSVPEMIGGEQHGVLSPEAVPTLRLDSRPAAPRAKQEALPRPSPPSGPGAAPTLPAPGQPTPPRKAPMPPAKSSAAGRGLPGQTTTSRQIPQKAFDRHARSLASGASGGGPLPGLIGPVGYDVSG